MDCNIYKYFIMLSEYNKNNVKYTLSIWLWINDGLWTIQPMEIVFRDNKRLIKYDINLPASSNSLSFSSTTSLSSSQSTSQPSISASGSSILLVVARCFVNASKRQVTWCQAFILPSPNGLAMSLAILTWSLSIGHLHFLHFALPVLARSTAKGFSFSCSSSDISLRIDRSFLALFKRSSVLIWMKIF